MRENRTQRWKNVKLMSELIDGILYVQDPTTGEYKRFARLDEIDISDGNDVIDKRITRWLGNDEMTFTVELPKVIDTTAREVDGDAINRR